MKFLVTGILLFLTACAPISSFITGSRELSDGESAMDAITKVDLPEFGPAPELNNQVWLNTDQPLRLADLRGQVVLLDMWTYG